MGEPVNGEDAIARRQLVREAADLWLRLKAQPDDAALQDEARQWRARSAAHERALAAAQGTWTLAGELETPPALPPLPTLPAGHVRRARRRARSGGARRAIKALAGAAAVASLAVASFPTLSLLWQADHRTGIGEKRSISLADGSSVTLDTASAIAVEDGGGHRGVRLLAGRAWFDVAKDKAHPFTVAAGDVRVTVTGTAFDVGLADDAIDVALAEGGVRVTRASGAPVIMRPGDRLHIARSSHEAARSRSAVASMGSWRRDRLLLEDVPLSEGIAQLGRYHRGTILLTSPALGRKRVTGVFDVRTPDDALRLMIRQHRAVVRQVTPWLLIVSES